MTESPLSRTRRQAENRPDWMKDVQAKREQRDKKYMDLEGITGPAFLVRNHVRKDSIIVTMDADNPRVVV